MGSGVLLLHKLSKLPSKSFISAFGRLSTNLCECYRGVRVGRAEITERLIMDLGISLAGVARILGVSTSAVSKILNRIDRVNSE